MPPHGTQVLFLVVKHFTLTFFVRRFTSFYALLIYALMRREINRFSEAAAEKRYSSMNYIAMLYANFEIFTTFLCSLLITLTIRLAHLLDWHRLHLNSEPEIQIVHLVKG